MLFLADGFFSFMENLTFLPALLLVIGTIMFSVEMFVPGFGVFGTSGIVCYLIAILLTAKDIFQFLAMLVLLLALLAVLTTITLVLVSKGKIPSKMILKDSIDGVSVGQPTNQDMEMYVGMVGTALSTLRPSGTCDINGVRLDVLTEGEFIEIGTKVIVTKIDEGHIIVKSAK